MAAKPNAATTLAEQMLAALSAQRDRGPDAYPTPLEWLVDLTDSQSQPELVEQAIGKKQFKTRALVSQKNNRDAPVALIEDMERLAASPRLLEFVLNQLCTPESPTCALSKLKGKVEKALKKAFEDAVVKQIHENTLPPTVGYRLEKKKPFLYLQRQPPLPPPPPPPPPEEVLANKLLVVLNAQRLLGGHAYPLSRKRLVELAEPNAKATLVNKALAHSSLQGKLALVDAKKEAAPLALLEDREQLISSAALLQYLLGDKRKPTAQAFPADGLLPRKSDLRHPFVASVHQRIESGSLPSTVGWMWIGKKIHVFFLEDVHGAAAPLPTMVLEQPVPPREAPADFAQAFDDAFNQINRQTGAHNFVSLVKLRAALSLPRDHFDAELRKLRIAGRYTLSGAEGRHGLTPEDREAGIVEDGSLLLYVSRKTP